MTAPLFELSVKSAIANGKYLNKRVCPPTHVPSFTLKLTDIGPLFPFHYTLCLQFQARESTRNYIEEIM